MCEMLAILTDVRAVCLSHGLNRWRTCCVRRMPRVWGHLVQRLSNYFDHLLTFVPIPGVSLRICVCDCDCSKRSIAESNYVIHEVHCRRNIVLCDQCDEPVPLIDLETHVKDVHAPIKCELCGSAVQRDEVEQHRVCVSH